MESKDDVSFLQYNIRLLRTVGLWPLASASRPLLLLYSFYTALLFVCLAVVSAGQIIEIFFSPDITAMASAVDLATMTASALFKMVYILWYHRHFQLLVYKIDSTFVQSDLFNGNFKMSNWVQHSKIYINFYVSMGVPALFILGALPPYFIPQYFKRYENNDEDSEYHMFPDRKRQFPLNCWFPIDVTWSPLYEIVYFLETLSLVNSGHIYLTSDAFFFMIIHLICGQLELLKASYRGMQEKLFALKKKISTTEESVLGFNYKSPNSWEVISIDKNEENNINQVIKKLIDFHNNLIETISELDALLRSMILVDFIHAVVSLSFATLQMFTSNTAYEWFQMMFFIWVCIVHQFMNNYFGEILTQKQRSVREAVYDSPWVESSSLHKMAVQMALTQADRPVRLSGWRMYHLGLSTFVEFMKLLASYVLVLMSIK